MAGKIFVQASPESSYSTVQQYGYQTLDPQLGGIYDIGATWTDPPGLYSGALNHFLQPEVTANVVALTGSVLPNPIYAPAPGWIVAAYSLDLGWAEFICLRVKTSTAIPVGSIVTWDATYAAALCGTTKSVGTPIAVSVSSATVSSGTPVLDPLGGGLASNSTNVMYAWFQLTGRAWTLKTNVQVTPNVPIFISGTSGRFKVISSAGGQFLGARAATATTTTTQSLALVYWQRAFVEGA